MRMPKAVYLVVIASILCFAGCKRDEAPKRISLEKKTLPNSVGAPAAERPVRIAVGGMITPKEGFIYYKEFIDYVGKKIGKPVRFVEKEKYEEINRLMRTGDIDAAFVCSGPYVDGHDEFGMELLAAPQAYGGTVYYSYIIVAKDSPIISFAGLRGKRFAFADPLSNSGALVPTYMLAKMNETPDTFFKQVDYTYAHDKSIKAVAQKMVDGAAVDSLIWEYLNRTNPEFTSKTRILKKSPPYAIPPVAVRKGVNPLLKKKIQQAFLEAHNDPEGSELLKHMMIERFVRIDDRAYDSVREMKAWIAQRQMKSTKGQ